MSEVSQPEAAKSQKPQHLSTGQVIQKILLVLGGLALGSFIGFAVCLMLGIISC